jgi:predicted MPP superfamily phosphohydrolase
MNTGRIIGPGRIKIETIRLKLQRLAPAFSGIRIVQISDIHIGGWMNAERLRRIVDLIVAETPDAAVITGDFLLGSGFDDDSKSLIQDLVNVLSPLAELIPTHAVLGNHDYWTNANAIREMLQASKITDLTNSVLTLTRGSARLHLCGVDDVWDGDVRLQDVLDQLPADGAAILLAHEPDFADESAATGRFDLQISGHSHGGQVVIPFIGPPVLPYLGRKYPSGLYKVGKMFQYTNRGIGTGRLPIRFFCPPEITIFQLEAS